MTALLLYGAKVVVFLLIAGAFYRLVLAREPLGQLRRVYLLLALVGAHLIPLLPVRVLPAGPVLAVEAATSALDYLPTAVVTAPASLDSAPTPQAGGLGGTYPLLAIYLLGLLWTGGRLIRSLRRVTRQARTGYRHRHGRAWLIELPGTVATHTFGRWIFYGAQNPPAPAVLAHEYAHATQWHTLDRLFVAALRVVCWCNPLLWLYERAIIQNHELLADRAVLRRGFPLRDYQYSLLAALGRQGGRPRLASGADFHFTKKRLQMMILPAASPARTSVLWGLSAALILVLGYGFGRTITAETAIALPPTPINVTPVAASDTVPPPPPPNFAILERKPRRPAAEQLAIWQDVSVYGVWIDGKRVDNEELQNYSAEDFLFYNVSRLMRNARNYGKLDYEVNLTTKATFQRNRYQPNWQGASCRWEAKPARDDC